jgi:hypothetical protein
VAALRRELADVLLLQVTPLKKIPQRCQASKLRGKPCISQVLHRRIHGVAHRTAHRSKTSKISILYHIGPSEDLSLDVLRKVREGCRFTRLLREEGEEGSHSLAHASKDSALTSFGDHVSRSCAARLVVLVAAFSRRKAFLFRPTT